MVEPRQFIDELREKFGVPYPLADRRPLVSGKQLVYDAQTATQLDAEFCLVAVIDKQYLLTPPGDAFVHRVDWDGDTAAAWRPHPNPGSPVRISPEIRFGKPAIKGISTEALWEQADIGEEIEGVADTYNLAVADVRWALAYENARRAA
jgi:uncharacterized protein (DUF433 family)